MAELVDAHDSKSCGATHGSSILPPGTMKKLICIVGPTASGKSDLAVEIAKKIGGEVVSADSRQIYKGLNVGSGKITKKEMQGIPHYLLDVASPKRVFTVSDYQKKTEVVLNKIWKKNKVPILVGGTGQYIEAVVDGLVFPEVPPNKILRKKLDTASLSDLQKKLKKLDPRRYKEIDTNNPVRLIRAIEIATHLGKVPKLKKQKRYFETLIIGIKTNTDDLREKIHIRLLKRMRQGMLDEVKKLHKKEGVSWKRLESLGLEYRYLAYYLQNKMSKREMLEKLEIEIGRYAKRQRTWFKRDKRIKWFSLKERDGIRDVTKDFLR